MAPERIRFASTDQLDWCIPSKDDPIHAELAALHLGGVTAQVAFVGLMFTIFTIVDGILAFFHGLAGIDYMVHHVAFIVAGVLIRGHCMLPFNAAILMSMEVSNIFLNWMMFFRHREGFTRSVAHSSGLFAAFFFVFRIGLNTYGAAYMWWAHDAATPPAVPEW